MASNASRLKEALAGGQAKEKGPVVADGVLSITPDPPEASWSKSVLESLSADSSFLEDDGGKQPNQLFGKFTWKIENFSDISNHGSKRELRSNQFNVGEYKWYILVYPQGCDVCNHLSLFLCVADYDKLLPGWSHFAQFTIAVVNKDPKKSKYSDTLHRFCKKEHDWGWKKFMELNKVLDGFTVADTLVIKAQVQVILDRPTRPFRCLDSQYRRELVRVYLTNVESICRRFCEEKRQRLAWLRDDVGCFKSWWRSLSPDRQQQLSREKGEAILKGIVKQFFNEKEVTSTLVMDALFCGCKQLEKLGKNRSCLPEGFSPPTAVITGRSCTFSFAMDALEIAEQLNQDFIPVSRDDKAVPLGADGLGLRSGCDELSELRRDALERDEKRLAELGRKTVEMYALAHIFTERVERAYRDYESEQRMKDLIAEEEEAGRLQDERAAARAAAEKEKKAKKKERMRAKKEAERVKREAEEAERLRQLEEKRAEQDRKAAEAIQRRKQDEVAVLHQHQQPAATASHKQQQEVAANGTLQGSSSSSISNQLRMQQQAGSSTTALGAPSAAAEALSRPGSAGVGPSSSTYGRFSSSSSPVVGSAAASIEAASTSDSDTHSVDSSSSQGFAPVRRRHQQHHYPQHPQHLQQLQQQSRPGSASSSGARRRGPASIQQQQQQLFVSSSGSGTEPGLSGGGMPTGYAAAVAGMRPPPPAEATATAVAMAEQQRRIRDLEDQVSVLTKQVQEWQHTVSQRDAIIARKDQETADLRAQLVRQQQQMQDLEKQAADLRAAAAAASKDGILSSNSSSIRSQTSCDDAPPATAPTPWAAVAAGGVSSARAAADAAAAAGQQKAMVSPPGSVGDSVASEQQYSGSCHVGAAAAADRPPTAAASRTASYAETVSGMGNQHHPASQQQQQQSLSRLKPAGSTSVSSSSRQSSSNLPTSSSSRSRSAADAADCLHGGTAAEQVAAVSGSSNGLIGSPTGAASSGRASSTAEEGLSEVDVPVSPTSLARSGSAAGAGVAPGPAGASGSADDRTAVSGISSATATRSSSGFEGAAVHEAAAAAAPVLKSEGRIGAVRASSAGSRGSSSVDGLPGLSLKGPANYLSNGIAGVLHTTATCTGNSPLTPSYRSAALQQAARSNGSSDAAAVSGVSDVGCGSGGKNKASALASSDRDPFSAFGGNLADNRGMPFGPMPGASKAPSGVQRASQTSLIDDAGLDGFVHMNMIDDLLTE